MKHKTPLIRKQTIGENVLYTLVFIAIYLIPILNSFLMAEEHIDFYNKVFLAWSIITPYLVLFLLNNYILINFILNKGYIFGYVITAFSVSTITFAVIELLEKNLIISDGYTDVGILPHQASLADLAWYWNVLLGIFLAIANCGIKFIFKSIQDEHRMAEMESQNLQSEMDALKYQINPHFFMNTLNNIHALIDIDTDAAKTTVIELSKMMRYVLYDTENQVTDVEKDIRFIEHYIALMRIRYTDAVDVKLTIRKEMPTGAKVPPLLLIVFIENAFKHGVSYNEPSFVHINLSVDEEFAYAEVRNSLHKNKNQVYGGVGLVNVRKRLDLIYGKKYTLDIDQSSDEYIVKLKIPILI